MLTIEDLIIFGADTNNGLTRCVNNEDVYLRLVNSALDNKYFEKLSTAVAAGDREAAFEAIHVIKDIMSILGLTPIYEVAAEMSELLRAGKDMDYTVQLNEILYKRAVLIKMRDS